MLSGFNRGIRSSGFAIANRQQDPDKGWDHLTRKKPELQAPLRMALERLKQALDEGKLAPETLYSLRYSRLVDSIGLWGCHTDSSQPPPRCRRIYLPGVLCGSTTGVE